MIYGVSISQGRHLGVVPRIDVALVHQVSRALIPGVSISQGRHLGVVPRIDNALVRQISVALIPGVSITQGRHLGVVPRIDNALVRRAALFSRFPAVLNGLVVNYTFLSFLVGVFVRLTHDS